MTGINNIFEEDNSQTTNLELELMQLRQKNQQLQAQLNDAVAQKQKLANKLKQCESGFDALLNSSPRAVYEIDADFRLRWFNEAASKSFERIVNQPLQHGQSLLPYLTPEVLPFFQEYVNRALQGEKVIYDWKYSNQLWFVVEFAPAIHVDGTVRGVRISELDLLQYKDTLQELSAQKEQFQSFARTASDPIFVVDQETLKILYANPAACRHYGYSISEFLKLKVNHMLPDPNGEPEPRNPEPGKVYTCFHRKKCGEIFPAEVSIGVFKQNGRILITTIVRDISERQETEQRLRESEEKFRLIADNSQDMIAMTTMEGRYVYLSPSHKVILGYELDVLKKKSPLELIHPDDFNGSDTWQNSQLAPFRFRRANGSWVWLEGRSYTITLKGIPYIIAIARDITLRVHAEEQLRESLQEKEVLLAEVHHRVRNNLAIIISLLKLQVSTLEDNKARALLQESQSRIRSMSMIHEMLYQSDSFAHIDFKEYVKELVAFIRKVYPHPNSQIKVSLELSDLYLGLSEAVPCGLILNELLSNAYQHAFPGQSNGHIYISAYRQNDCIILKVEDNGIGFNYNLQKSSTKSLGMKLVNRLTRQLGGVLKFSPEGGSCFTVTFPVQD